MAGQGRLALSGRRRDGAVTGPWKLGAANPFVAAAFDGRLWIADFGGTDVVVVDPTQLPSP